MPELNQGQATTLMLVGFIFGAVGFGMLLLTATAAFIQGELNAYMARALVAFAGWALLGMAGSYAAWRASPRAKAARATRRFY